MVWVNLFCCFGLVVKGVILFIGLCSGGEVGFSVWIFLMLMCIFRIISRLCVWLEGGFVVWFMI